MQVWNVATSGFNRTEKIRSIKERCVKDNTQRCGITTERVLSRQWAVGRSARLSDKFPKKAMLKMPTSASVECGYEWFQSKAENSWY